MVDLLQRPDEGCDLMTKIEMLSQHLISIFRDRAGVAPDFENEARRILRMLNVPTGEDGPYNKMSAAEIEQAARMP